MNENNQGFVAPVAQPVQGQPAVNPAQVTPQQYAPAPTAPIAPVQPAAPVQQFVPEPLLGNAPKRTTEQFEKLIEANKRLYAEIQRRDAAATQFAPLTQSQPAQPAIASYEDIDPVTGQRYVDGDKLARTIDQLTQSAKRAEEKAEQLVQQSQQREIQRQEIEAFNSYPELDPKNPNKDKEFEKQTRQVIYDSLIHPQDYKGRPFTFKEAADYVKTRQTPQAGQPNNESSVTPEQQQEIEAAQENKAQASAALGSQPPSAIASADDEAAYSRLRQGTVLGDDRALAIRLTHTDHVGSPTAGE